MCVCLCLYCWEDGCICHLWKAEDNPTELLVLFFHLYAGSRGRTQVNRLVLQRSVFYPLSCHTGFLLHSLLPAHLPRESVYFCLSSQGRLAQMSSTHTQSEAPLTPHEVWKEIIPKTVMFCQNIGHKIAEWAWKQSWIGRTQADKKGCWWKEGKPGGGQKKEAEYCIQWETLVLSLEHRLFCIQKLEHGVNACPEDMRGSGGFSQPSLCSPLTMNNPQNPSKTLGNTSSSSSLALEKHGKKKQA